MRIKEMKLSRPVIIQGFDYFGRKTEMTLTPYDELGWFWKCGHEIIPISSNILHSKTRHLALRSGRRELHVIEHLLALRWLGLNSVLVDCEGNWLPYHGRSLELHEKVLCNCYATDREIPWFAADEAICRYPKGDRYTKYTPTTSSGLTLKIICDYAGLGRNESIFRIGEDPSKIFASHTQGYPAWLYYPSVIAGLVWWPHHDKITWPQKSGNETLNKFVLHRTTDLLGGLALFNSHGLLAGEVTSYCSGHWADAKLVREVGTTIRKLS